MKKAVKKESSNKVSKLTATQIKAHKMAEITMALSRAYTKKKHEKKELDISLVNDMASEVLKVLKNLK